MSLTQEGWIRLLEKVLGVSISDKLDSIDIAWNGIEQVAKCLSQRQMQVIKLRMENGFTLSECVKLVKRNDGKGKLTTAVSIRLIEQSSLRLLRSYDRIKAIRSCIAGFDNLRFAGSCRAQYLKQKKVAAPVSESKYDFPVYNPVVTFQCLNGHWIPKKVCR